jgi:hypothetical protein
MSRSLTEDEIDRETHRTLILGLAGFSFTALAAFAAIDVVTEKPFHVPIYFLFTSFLFYMVALNLQGYKLRRWQDLLGDCLIDSAALCLIMSVVAIVWRSNASRTFQFAVLLMSGMAWIVDHAVRVHYQYNDLSLRERAATQRPAPRDDLERPRRLVDTYKSCSKHDILHPEGTTCPQCAVDEQTKKGGHT